MKRLVNVLCATAMALCLPLTAQGQGKQTKAAKPKIIQEGTLGNEKLQYDAMMGVAAKTGTLGCGKITDVKPFVTRMPSGAVGSRAWQEMWVVECGRAKHNVLIDFKESRGTGVDWRVH